MYLTTQHGNTDALSRLPLPDTLDTVPLPGEFVFLIDHLADGPITAAQLKAWSAKDPLLTKVLYFIRNAWPNTIDDSDLKPYFAIRWEMTKLDGCIIW